VDDVYSLLSPPVKPFVPGEIPATMLQDLSCRDTGDVCSTISQIKSPEVTVKHRRKAYPHYVRYEQNSGRLRYLQEIKDGKGDCNPQHDDIYKPRKGRPEAEEEHRPHDVEDQLYAEEPESYPNCVLSKIPAPYEKERYPHEQKERDPHR
jgi:hypothetical protein